MSAQTVRLPQDILGDFPVLQRQIHQKRLAYLDSAASSLTPLPVLEAMDRYYRTVRATIHRGVYTTAEEATDLYEGARRKVARFLGGVEPEEVVFVRNSTEALNLVAMSYGEWALRPGQAVLLSVAEHHSNLLPWQRLVERKAGRLEFLPLTPGGELDLSLLDRLLERDVAIVSLAHVSNVLGYELPLAELAEKVHRAGAVLVVDGAQSVPHLPVHPRELGVDFLAFSGHKMLGPTGIGVLWGRREWLEAMPPFLMGGDMVGVVHLTEATYAPLPAKFEAGTGAIAEAIGLGAAVDYLERLGMDNVAHHSRQVGKMLYEALSDLPGVTVYGPKDRHAVAAFNVEGVHAHDVATILDRYGVAVRAGHHCCQPLMSLYQTPAMVRASGYVYTQEEDVKQLVRGIREVQKVFGVTPAGGGGR